MNGVRRLVAAFAVGALALGTISLATPAQAVDVDGLLRPVTGTVASLQPTLKSVDKALGPTVEHKLDSLDPTLRGLGQTSRRLLASGPR